MKFLIVLVMLISLNSCNTCIGIGRDAKQGYEWTKSKFQEPAKQDANPAPVY